MLKKENRYKILEFCLTKLTDDEFKSMLHSLREDDSTLMKLSDNISKTDFLGKMQKKGKLKNIEKYLSEEHPDCFPTPFQSQFAACHNFINREDERNKACSKNAPQYILFDAPAKYGKTELLEKIRQKYSQDGWHTIYVSIKKDEISSALELSLEILKIADEQQYQKNDHVKRIEDIAMTLAKHIKIEQKSSRTSQVKVIFLIDNIDKLTEEEFVLFADEFIPAVQKIILDVRVQMFGRYISVWEGKVQKIKPKAIQLSPFKFEYVLEMVKLRLPDLDEVAIKLRAASLMHLTGGHPGLMAQILEKMPQDKEKQLEFIESSKDIVLKEANTIRESIPAKLQKTFDVLSVCRRYDDLILNKFIKKGLITWKEDYEDELAGALLNTHLVSRWEKQWRFIQDEIVRRLLAVRLRLEHPDKFHEYCQNARDIYHADLQTAHSRQDIIFIEGLYQELQLGSCNEEAKNRLRQDFFSDDGIVHQYLNLLIERSEKIQSISLLRSIEASLKDEEEWEFRFAVNFCLLESDYSDITCDKLYKKINDFILKLKENRRA